MHYSGLVGILQVHLDGNKKRSFMSILEATSTTLREVANNLKSRVGNIVECMPLLPLSLHEYRNGPVCLFASLIFSSVGLTSCVLLVMQIDSHLRAPPPRSTKACER